MSVPMTMWSDSFLLFVMNLRILTGSLFYFPRRVLVQRPKPEAAPYHSSSVYIQGQRIFVVEKVRNMFVVGEAFSV